MQLSFVDTSAWTARPARGLRRRPVGRSTAADACRRAGRGFASLADIRSVGVMGDERTYPRPVVVRAATRSDAARLAAGHA